MSVKSEKAVEYFMSGYTCAQSVLLAFAEDLGMEFKAAARLSDGLGGGIAKTDNVCGAITAMAAAISLKHGKELPDEGEKHAKTYDLVGKAVEEFKASFDGMKNCTQLLGKNLSVQEEFEQAVDGGMFHKVCPSYVEKAVEIAEKYIAM